MQSLQFALITCARVSRNSRRSRRSLSLSLSISLSLALYNSISLSLSLSLSVSLLHFISRSFKSLQPRNMICCSTGMSCPRQAGSGSTHCSKPQDCKSTSQSLNSCALHPEATDLRFCIPLRLYGDGAESTRRRAELVHVSFLWKRLALLLADSCIRESMLRMFCSPGSNGPLFDNAVPVLVSWLVYIRTARWTSNV